MKITFLKNIIFIFVFAIVSSCTVPEPHPSNEIISNNGIKIILEWRTGSSSLQALEDADLDLYLIKGQNQVRWSENSGNFETVFLEDVFADGEYIVAVGSHEIFKSTEFTVYISDMTVTNIVTVTSNFEIGENDRVVNFVKIQKRGSKYMITQM